MLHLLGSPIIQSGLLISWLLLWIGLFVDIMKQFGCQMSQSDSTICKSQFSINLLGHHWMTLFDYPIILPGDSINHKIKHLSLGIHMPEYRSGLHGSRGRIHGLVIHGCYVYLTVTSSGSFMKQMSILQPIRRDNFELEISGIAWGEAASYLVSESLLIMRLIL